MIECYFNNCSLIINKKYIDNNFNSKNHYIYCQKCIKNIKVCSKSKLKKIFMLSDKDILNEKTIYLKNNTDGMFYLYDDIYNIVLNKYGSFENYKDTIEQKKKNRDVKIKKGNELKLQREKELKKELMMNKLEYKKYGDCYSYVNYGKPDIKTVIKRELEKEIVKNNRRIELAQELSKYSIKLDENLKTCYEYINGIDSESIYEKIDLIRLEHRIRNEKDINIQYKLCNDNNNIKIKNIIMETKNI